MHRVPALPLLLLLVPGLAVANDCRYTAQRDFDVDAAGLRRLEVTLHANDLVLEGAPGLAKVEVRARACASEAAWLADLTVEQHRAGDRLVIEPHPHERAFSFGMGYAYIDLRVRVPQTLLAEIHSGSGDADVAHVAALDYQAGSGDLRVDHIAGPLNLEVGSGDVSGSEVGSVDARGTSSGDISITDVHGPVEVGGTGSGDLVFRRVGGSVHVGHVGSGDVSLDGVQGDVGIDAVGSGDVSVADVGGDFTVHALGSGDVHHHGVHGTVSLPRED
jgi:hypothetical protein